MWWEMTWILHYISPDFIECVGIWDLEPEWGFEQHSILGNECHKKYYVIAFHFSCNFILLQCRFWKFRQYRANSEKRDDHCGRFFNIIWDEGFLSSLHLSTISSANCMTSSSTTTLEPMSMILAADRQLRREYELKVTSIPTTWSYISHEWVRKIMQHPRATKINLSSR